MQMLIHCYVSSVCYNKNPKDWHIKMALKGRSKTFFSGMAMSPEVVPCCPVRKPGSLILGVRFKDEAVPI